MDTFSLKLPPNFDEIRSQYQADWVRLAILKHGTYEKFVHLLKLTLIL